MHPWAAFLRLSTVQKRPASVVLPNVSSANSEIAVTEEPCRQTSYMVSIRNTHAQLFIVNVKNALCTGFPGSSVNEESTCNAGDPGLIPGLGKSPGGGHSNSLQYSCLENHKDRGACKAAVCGVTQSWTPLKRLMHACALCMSALTQKGIEQLPVCLR